MMKGRRSSSTSVIMEVADDRAPLVVIDTTDVTINTGESVRLNSVISTYNKKPVTIFWECGQLEGNLWLTTSIKLSYIYCLKKGGGGHLSPGMDSISLYNHVIKYFKLQCQFLQLQLQFFTN